MAPINQINGTSQEYNSLVGTWGATICLMIGMIVSVLGIKIWWFKHRLNFEQTPTQNGDARGTQAVYRSTSKDKKQLQEVCDSVVVHGVFRKRREDEMEVIDRPKQLPPVRVQERSMSTTVLIPPPRTKRNLPTTPDKEPAKQCELNGPTLVANIAEERSKTPPADQSILESESFVDTLPVQSPSNMPNETERLFQKAKTPGEKKTFEKMTTERRGTGYLTPIETQDLENLLAKGNEPNVLDENTVEDNSYVDEPFKEPITPVAFPAAEMQRSPDSPISLTEPTELFFKDLESIENVSERGLSQYEAIENIFDDAGHLSDSEINTNQIQISSMPEHTGTVGNEVPLNAAEPIYAVSQRASKVQKLIIRNEDMEPHWKHDEFWEEENHNNTRTDRDFEKRRHSYQEHEGHFLELNEPINQTQSPTGFGKSIDDDWENFKDLKTTTFDGSDNEVNWKPLTENSNTSAISTMTTTTKVEMKANFDLKELETVTERHLYMSRSSSGAYVQSIEELYDELSDDDDVPASQIVVTHEVSPPQKSSILKDRLQDFSNAGYGTPTVKTRKLKSQQKVTFDAHTEEYYLPENESDSANEDNFYGKYNDEDDYDDDEDEDEFGFRDRHIYQDIEDVPPPRIPPPPLPKNTMPTPMQRTTLYAVEDISMEQTFGNNGIADTTQQQKHRAALLFSTQISETENSEANDAFDTENENWKYIRQRRYQTDDVEQASVPKPVPHGSPRPADRSFFDLHTHIQPSPRPRRSSTEA